MTMMPLVCSLLSKESSLERVIQSHTLPIGEKRLPSKSEALANKCVNLTLVLFCEKNRNAA